MATSGVTLFGLLYILLRWGPMIVGAYIALRARRHCPRGPGLASVGLLMLLGAELILIVGMFVGFSPIARGPGAQQSAPSIDWGMVIVMGVFASVIAMTLAGWACLLIGVFSRRFGMVGCLIAHQQLGDDA